MKRALCTVVALALIAVPFKVAAQGKKDRDEILAEMMQKKLKSTHLVLDGVAIGDFKKITIGGKALIKLANSETWQLIRSPDYERHSADFIRATEKLVKKAQDKNIDGAALAYVEMTLSCVRCHQYVREHRREARMELEPSESALDYINKDQGTDKIIEGIRRVLESKVYLSDTTIQMMLPAGSV